MKTLPIAVAIEDREDVLKALQHFHTQCSEQMIVAHKFPHMRQFATDGLDQFFEAIEQTAVYLFVAGYEEPRRGSKGAKHP